MKKTWICKRILAIVLCVTLLFGTNVSALAGDTVSGGDAIGNEETIVTEETEEKEDILPELTGNYGEDVAAFALSQIGQAEWNGLFVKSCVSYAKIPTDRFPIADTVADWVQALNSEEYGMYVSVTEGSDEYAACVGDLLFLDKDADGNADCMAVIVEVSEDGTIEAVEEQEGVAVKVSYAADDACVLGYGMIPFNMEGIESDIYSDDNDSDDTVSGNDIVDADDESTDDESADDELIIIESSETDDWEATLPLLSGVYADDLVAVANSQLGYTQSAEDVSRNEDGEVIGYFSRYGSWNETPYAEWNALFVKFCLNYANIPTDKFPQADTAAEWIAALQSEEYDLFIPATVSPDEYEPFAGDLIFLNTDEIGIIKSITNNAYQVIQEKDGAVSELEYTKADASIIGYGMLPINMVDENGVEDEGASYEEKVPVTSTHVNTHEMENEIPYPYKNPDDYKVDNPTGNDAMKLNKVINGTADPNIFDLTLDAYGTGTQAQVTVTTPMDIVLVLDASGSMSQSDHYITVTGKHDIESFNKMYEGCTFYDYSSNASTEEKPELWLQDAIIESINQTDGKPTYYSYKDSYGQKIPRPNPITYCKDCGKWIKETRQDVVAKREVVNAGENKYYIQSNYTYEEVDIITLMNSGNLFETNMQATERGLKEFVSMVKAQGEASGVEHRIAIVDYGYYEHNKGKRYSSTTGELITTSLMTSLYLQPGSVYSYKAIYGSENQGGSVKSDYEKYMKNPFMSVNDAEELNKIDRAIWRYQDVLYCSAYTSTHYGMKMARDILERREDTTRADESNAMVVVFADGAPGNGFEFYQNWANASLDYANEIKEMDVPIYVVGLYDQADASDVGTNTAYTAYYNTSNKFFNYLSSNYDVELSDEDTYYAYNKYGDTNKKAPDAVIKATENNDGKQYFYSARNGEALAQAFNSIATSVEDKATTSITLDSTTIMREQISKYFELECNCEGNEHICIEVYTQTWNGTAFGDEVKVYPGESQDPDVKDISVTIKDGKTIDVTGFSYMDFPVITEYDQEGNVIGGSGKKLLLKVQVETEEGFWGGNNVPTNEKPSNGSDQTGTAIYFKNEIVDGGVFPVPEANVPLHLNIEALDKTIYYGGDISADDLIDKITAGYKTTVGDIQGDPKDTIANLKVTVNADGTLTPAEDWMDDYANLTWTSDSVTPATEIANKSDSGKEYEFEVVMTPTKPGTANLSGNQNQKENALAGAAVDANGLTDKATGYAYILVPEVTFQDSLVFLGFVPDDMYYHNTNKVTADGAENWKVDGSFTPEITAGDDDPKTYPAVSGEKPNLTYTYEIASENKNFVQDTPINVSVKSSNVDGEEKDITGITTFNWLCGVENKESYHDPNEDIITPHNGSIDAFEFWIHLKEPYELPSTGGPSMYWYMFSGMLLMMAGTLILYNKKRKEVLGR